jgi:hypothetical protein
MLEEKTNIVSVLFRFRNRRAIWINLPVITWAVILEGATVIGSAVWRLKQDSVVYERSSP